MIIYPMYEKVEMIPFFKTPFILKMYYSVIDKKAIISYTSHTNTMNFKISPQWILYFPQTKIFFNKFHIQVPKFKVISLKNGLFTANHHIEMYDGPDTLSPKAKFHNHSSRTSSFQCIIYWRRRMSQNKEESLNYSVQINPNIKTVNLNISNSTFEILQMSYTNLSMHGPKVPCRCRLHT